MVSQFRCDNENRRRLVLEHATLNGIDYLEVLDEGAIPLGLPRQQVLLVRFLTVQPPQLPKPIAALTEANVRIEAVQSSEEVGVMWVRRADLVTAGLPADPSTGDLLTAAQAGYFTGLDDSDHILVVLVNGAGDFSTYTLRVVNSPTDDAPPANIDQRLASIAFSFKVECPSDFDCKDDTVCPPEAFEEPVIDYLAKDYTSFRRLILDRLSIVMPDWRDRSPADLQIALVELMAYVGDYLSYYQDAVATEAYLSTARRRVSVRRHARLLDYHMHDGCNARAWVHFEVTASPVALSAGTELRTRGDDYLVFETMHETMLHSAHNKLRFYTWGDTECYLPAGATRATLRYDPVADAVPADARLKPGDVLIVEEVLRPTTNGSKDPDPACRHAVRLTEVIRGSDDVTPPPVVQIVEVAWHEADALPFALCLSAVLDGVAVDDVSVAWGNVVLADHGATVADEPLEPDVVPAEGRYRPRLGQNDATFAAAYDDAEARTQPAALALRQDPRAALPQATLDDGDETWTPQRHLLGSDRFAAEFIVEVERDGEAHLRFGDDVVGKQPAAGSMITATYRIGNGADGNVGAEGISVVVGLDGISARNPLPAEGGVAPESMEEVRHYAPQAFRTQERAVTESDYAEVTERHAEVQKAAATFRWTGSWYTVFVTVDRKGGLPVREDVLFHRNLHAHIGRYRLAGYDLELNDPVFVPLDLALAVCVAPGYFRSDVKRSLIDVFSRHDRPDGRRGFFHPDHFTFGQAVYLSQIVGAAMAVEGVASVEVRRFQRLDEAAADEIEEGVLQAASLEIARLDNDPSRPGNGKLELDMQGGL